VFKRVIFLLFFVLSISYSVDFEKEYSNKNIKILKTYKLKGNAKEVSDLAYDKKDDILYAISDKGILYHIKFNNNNAKVVKDKKLKLEKKSKKVDVEGLAIKDNKLIISFEREPKIAIFNKKGKEKDNLKLPEDLDDKDDYLGENKMLESLAFNSKYGVITSAQNEKGDFHTVYNLDGKICKFQKDEDLSAFEFIDDDDILTIERKVKDDKTKKLFLKKVTLNKNRQICKSKVLLELKSKKAKLYNYEGLTKISKNKFMMVNDNGSKDDTYLIMFEIR
jgi:hypothetical protein